MNCSGRIVELSGNRILLECDADVEREVKRKEIKWVDLALDDGRGLSSEQRKKIFAIIRDISIWSGHEPEYIRRLLMWEFACKKEMYSFSLSNTDMTTAKEFINYLVDFCFSWDVPTRDALLMYTDDIGKYLYYCLEHRKCAICNKPAEIHHVDKIGMGRDREKIVHIGLKAIALCRNHHDMAHRDEKMLFEHNFLYGITLDKYLCEKLNLNAKKE